MTLGLRKLGDNLFKHFHDIQATWESSGRNLMPLVISPWIIFHIIKFDLALGLVIVQFVLAQSQRQVITKLA
jgi:hypothetical protein